jgi:hypothetical protein
MENIPMRNSALKAIADKRAAQENGTKTGDPIIKTKTVDPDTGAVTYKHSWSDTSMSSKPTTRSTTTTTAPRRSSPTISSVGSKKTTTAPKKIVTPVSKTTSGSREFTSVAPLTPAGKTDTMKPSAPLAKITEKATPLTKEKKAEIIYKKSYESSKKDGESFNDWYAKLDERTKAQSAKNRSKDLEGEIRTDKQMAGGCRGCR